MTTDLQTRINNRVEKMLAEQAQYNSEVAGKFNIKGEPMGDFSTLKEITEEATRVENWIEEKRAAENNTFVIMTTVEVLKSTEKAIQIKSKIRDFNKTAWIPKSQCEVVENGNVSVKAWFAQKENLTPVW